MIWGLEDTTEKLTKLIDEVKLVLLTVYCSQMLPEEVNVGLTLWPGWATDFLLNHPREVPRRTDIFVLLLLSLLPPCPAPPPRPAAHVEKPRHSGWGGPLLAAAIKVEWKEKCTLSSFIAVSVFYPNPSSEFEQHASCVLGTYDGWTVKLHEWWILWMFVVVA